MVEEGGGGELGAELLEVGGWRWRVRDDVMCRDPNRVGSDCVLFGES
jgi:hypothetical protein